MFVCSSTLTFSTCRCCGLHAGEGTGTGVFRMTNPAVETEKYEVVSGDQGLIASLTASTPDQPARVQHDIAPSAILKVLLALAAVWFLIRVFPVLILVVCSLMLVATFNPMVRKLQA